MRQWLWYNRISHSFSLVNGSDFEIKIEQNIKCLICISKRSLLLKHPLHYSALVHELSINSVNFLWIIHWNQDDHVTENHQTSLNPWTLWLSCTIRSLKSQLTTYLYGLTCSSNALNIIMSHSKVLLSIRKLPQISKRCFHFPTTHVGK